MKRPGKLLVFEGPDGAGKSTLAAELVTYLNKHTIKTELYAFPGNESGTLGKHIYQLHHAPHLFEINEIHPASLQILHIAAHIDAIKNHVYPRLNSGINIVLDRIWWSTWVYGKLGGVDEKPLQLMIDTELYYWGNNQPNAVFLIDSPNPFRTGIEDEYFNKLRVLYKKLLEQEKTKYPIHLISNDGSSSQALDEIIRHMG